MTQTTAEQLLERFKVKNSITVNINGVELKFNRDDAALDAFTNEVDKNNRITPIKDYLLATVDRDSKDTLVQIINVPGVAVALMEKVNGAFMPDLEVSLKN